METTFSGDSSSGKSYIAFFDLDGTITGAISGNEMVREAFTKGIMTRLDFARAIYLSLIYKLNLRDPQKIVDEMVSWVAGMTENNMVDLSSKIVRETLLPSVHRQARDEIQIHKKRNAKVVILSSALIYVCQEISINLNMDDIICSGLEVENGYLTGRPRGSLCFGKEKAIRLKNYCEINNTDMSDAWYYGDSISDLPALSLVGNPVCVNPDRKLKKAAHKRGWKIIDWKS
ncbi:MAG: HAD family hydrolase [Bacteroidetes bacterium]|nr:MAG: HAD family hydrolase [Bacteroidota bacterium]